MLNRIKIKILFGCLYIEGILLYFVELADEVSLHSILTFGIDLILLSIALSTLRGKSRHAFYLFFFILISTFSFLLNQHGSLPWHLNGIRELLTFLCLLIINDSVYKSRHIAYFHRLLQRFSWIFLAVQIPVTILQFMQYGPGDYVGGTFGKGGSGILTFSIFMLVFYLIEMRIDKGTPGERFKKLLFMLGFFIPVMFNETKITFVLIPIYFLSFVNFKKVTSSIAIITIGIVSTVLFSYLYSTQENVNYANPLSGIFSDDFLNGYLIGNEDYEDVPRLTKIAVGYTYLQQNNDLIFGQEYGAFKGSKGNNSAFTQKFEWLLRGSRPYLFYLLMSGGLLLTAFFIFIIVNEIRMKPYPGGKNYSRSLLFFMIALFIIILFYNDGFRHHIFSFIFLQLLLFSKHYRKTAVPAVLKKHKNWQLVV